MTGKDSEIISILIDEISEARLDHVNMYLFGSWLKNSGIAEDIDVLLVYPDGTLDRAHELAEVIRDIPSLTTLDVLALSTEEERELGFIENERAVRIWPES